MKQVARNLVLALVLNGLFAALTVSAFARDDVPRSPVEEGYAITIRTLAARGKAPPPAWRPPHRDKLMSQSLAALFARDDLYQDESGEMGQIGADPFLNGQDGEIRKLTFDTIPVAAGKATVLASFRSFGKPVAVQFQMVRENGGWRIDDIVNTVDGQSYSIREQLSQPYDCGSFMGKPCKR